MMVRVETMEMKTPVLMGAAKSLDSNRRGSGSETMKAVRTEVMRRLRPERSGTICMTRYLSILSILGNLKKALIYTRGSPPSQRRAKNWVLSVRMHPLMIVFKCTYLTTLNCQTA